MAVRPAADEALAASEAACSLVPRASDSLAETRRPEESASVPASRRISSAARDRREAPEREEAAVALYVEHMRLRPHVARGQVYSQQLTPGYFTTYYYGVKALERIQARLGWDDRRFSEAIFSCGKVSLDILERLLALPEPARHALLGSFATLSM